MSRTPRLVISTVPYLGLVSSGALVLMVAGCGGDSVSVTQPDEPMVASVTVSPSAVTLVGGETVQLTATVRNAEGVVLSGYPVTWRSTNTDCVIVDATGLATMGGPPGADVIATAEIDGVSVMGRAGIWP